MLNTFLKVGFVFCIFLLIINVFALKIFETSNTQVTFEDLLLDMQNAPVSDISFAQISNSMKITADWAIFNGFRDFLNFFTDILAFLAWIGVMLYNSVIYIGYFLYLIGLQSFSAVI